MVSTIFLFLIKQERRTVVVVPCRQGGRGQVRALQVEDTSLQLGLLNYKSTKTQFYKSHGESVLVIFTFTLF